MNTAEQLKQQKQLLAKLERDLNVAKLKQRKAETRRKIELGGLVVKAKLDSYPKAVILGALMDALEHLEKDAHYKTFFQSKGEAAFMGFGEKQ